MTKRKAFNFYSSHWEQIKLLNKKQQLELTIAICQVQFFEINIEDVVFKDNISTLVWTGIKHSIETSIKGFVSKHKALGKEVVIPLSKGGAKAPYQEEKEQGEVQVKGKGEEKVKEIPPYLEFKNYAFSKKSNLEESSLKLKYDAWVVNDWKDGFNKPIKNWKSKLLNTIPHLKENINGQRKKLITDVNPDMANNPNRMSFD